MEKQWKFRMSFINVGNGDAILLEIRNKSLKKGSFVMLIDGGSGEPAEYEYNDTGRMRVVEFLKRQQVDQIDVMVNTHIHEDHTCGLLDVIEQNIPAVLWQPFDVKLWEHMELLTVSEEMSESEKKFTAALNAYYNICKKLEELGIKIAGRDSSINETRDALGVEIPEGLKISVLGPSLQALENMEQKIKLLYHQTGSDDIQRGADEKLLKELDASMNDVSLVLLVEYEGHTFLLPGDMQAAGYNGCNNELHAEVFKVGHHGQPNALTMELLNKIAPKYAIISASSDRRYGSAAPEVLRMIHDFGAEIYFTDVPEVPPYTDGLVPHAGVAAEIMQDGSVCVRYLV